MHAAMHQHDLSQQKLMHLVHYKIFRLAQDFGAQADFRSMYTCASTSLACGGPLLLSICW